MFIVQVQSVFTFRRIGVAFGLGSFASLHVRHTLSFALSWLQNPYKRYKKPQPSTKEK